MSVRAHARVCLCGGVYWSDMLQGCYHSNSRMGQRVAMASRSRGQGEGPAGLPVCVCVFVLIGRVCVCACEVSSPAILVVLIMNGVLCGLLRLSSSICASPPPPPPSAGVFLSQQQLTSFSSETSQQTAFQSSGVCTNLASNPNKTCTVSRSSFSALLNQKNDTQRHI